MTTATTATRSFLSGFLGWGASRNLVGDERAFLHDRVRLNIKIGCLFLAGFWIYFIVRCLVVGHWAILWDPQRLAHGAVIAGLAGLWLYLGRQRDVALGVLHFVEGTGTVVLCALYALIVHYAPPGRELAVTVGWSTGVYLTLILRAAVVPSTRLRTFVVGVLSLAALLIAHPDVNVMEEEGGMTFTLRAFTGLTGGAFVVASMVVSRVIYGLQQEVRKAMQLGQYELIEKIGEGGMGAVYRASHSLLRRPTAVKLLPPEKAGEKAIARFEREVQITSRLTHPNTVAIYDFGRTPDGVFYYAMEYLDGLDLEELVELDGPQSPGRVIHVLAQCAHALAEAHSLGLIHRDIKPANVVLCDRGGMSDMVKVLDFGLVKEVVRTGDPALTAENAITGTPHYMAPEVILGREATAQSDLYALGAVGYALLTGKEVFEGSTIIEICGKHLHETPPTPSERRGYAVSEDLEAAILRCLAKDPARRPPDAMAFRRELLDCKDAGSWTLEQAAAWWTLRGDEVRGLRDQRRKSRVDGKSERGRITVAVSERATGGAFANTLKA